ncbi:MAG: class I SAM-dependent methyltransferase [Pseudomonadota bacterium]
MYNFYSPSTQKALYISADESILGTEDKSESYPIINGIPRFVEDNNYASAFGFQWKKFSKTQLDSYSNLTISEDRLKRVIGFPLSELNGMKVLEAGSGSGRFTEILLKYGSILDTFDYSNACEANKENHPDASIAQADIRAMPYIDNSYDLVICIGVLQHTPSPEESIKCLYSKLKNGGKLVIDHYRFKLRNILPPPIGVATALYRPIVKNLPPKYQWKFVNKLVNLFFPMHWEVRHSKLALRALRRISPVHFYFHELPLSSREMHYQWSLLDTHDGLADYYKHHRSVNQIKKFLEDLGCQNIECYISPSDGIEARAIKKVEYP